MSLSEGLVPARSEIKRPLAGSASPAMSSVTFATTRVVVCCTPGNALMRDSSDSGARVSDANTSANRARS